MQDTRDSLGGEGKGKGSFFGSDLFPKTGDKSFYLPRLLLSLARGHLLCLGRALSRRDGICRCPVTVTCSSVHPLKLS